MTRVLMVLSGLWNGGMERQMALLASELPERWAVSVLSMQDGPYRLVLEQRGIDVTLVPRYGRFDLTAGVGMWRIASSFRPDVVHCWSWMAALALVPYCRLNGIPLLNGTIRIGALPSRRARMYRLGISLSNMVVANNRSGLAAFGVAEGQCGRVIYNGFDPARLAAIDSVTKRNVSPKGLVVVMAARMSKQKDWDMFIRAAQVLSAESNGWRFIALGDGPDREEIERKTAALVDEGVLALPTVGIEVLPVIASADVGVLLSDPRWLAEGCSNSIMEYMACGLPVLCTRSGGNSELVENGTTGFLVAPGDVESLVSKLRALRDDRERLRELGQQGRRRIELRFTVEAMVAAYVSAYKFLLADLGSADE